MEPHQPGQLHGSAWLARAYRMANLDLEDLRTRGINVARSANDIDLELVALSQPGLMRVGGRDTDTGSGLNEEAIPAALAGKGLDAGMAVPSATTCSTPASSSPTSNAPRSGSLWPTLRRHLRLPFLFGIPHLLRGRATGRCADAVRELMSGLQITHGVFPKLHGAGGAGEPDPETSGWPLPPFGGREPVRGPGPPPYDLSGRPSTWAARMPSWSCTRPPRPVARSAGSTRTRAAAKHVRGSKCAPRR